MRAQAPDYCPQRAPWSDHPSHLRASHPSDELLDRPCHLKEKESQQIIDQDTLRPTVNDDMFELSSWHLVGEEDIELGERETPGLWKTEETPNITNDIGTHPEESGLGSKVPSRRIDEPRTNLAGDESTGDIGGSAHDN